MDGTVGNEGFSHYFGKFGRIAGGGFRREGTPYPQGVQSLMVVPMISRDGVYGYAGIDILDKPHTW